MRRHRALPGILRWLTQPFTSQEFLLHAPSSAAPSSSFSQQPLRCIASAATTTARSQRNVLKEVVEEQLAAMQAARTFKVERVITTPQASLIGVAPSPEMSPPLTSSTQSSTSVSETQGSPPTHLPSSSPSPVLNMCANNYLGLSNHPEVAQAAIEAIQTHGYGLSSVRFICGTQDIHKQLEKRISTFHGTEDTILFPSCFDANAGLFESILGAEDAVISDSLNHASIIDGIRLCKAKRYRYAHMDMRDLETKLQEADAAGARIKLVATDGVFSMDGDVAPLEDIVRLAKTYGAYTFVDDCHATGFVGSTGKGSDQACGVQGQVDIINSTLGKALGGATGGYTTGRAEVISLLRQRARPYLFSNTLAPPMVGASLKVFDLLEDPVVGPGLRTALARNTEWFRESMSAAGFDIRPGSHPIVPIMLGEASLATDMASKLLDKGVYVVGFSYPVVPKGAARIRVQISAAHSRQQLEMAVAAFVSVGKEMGVIK